MILFGINFTSMLLFGLSVAATVFFLGLFILFAGLMLRPANVPPQKWYDHVPWPLVGLVLALCAGWFIGYLID